MPSESNRRPVIFGEVLFDHFPDGSVVLGGAPFNVAWHLQAFGLAPRLISRVGDDALGRRIRDAMLSWGMDTAGLQLDSAHPTGTVQVSIQDGEPSFEIVAERAYDFISGDQIPPTRASILYHGSLAIRHQDSRLALQGLKQQLGAPVFVDVNLRPPWWQREEVAALLLGARWAKLNHDELALLMPAGDDLEARTRGLIADYGLELLIVTRGKRGAAVYAADGEALQVAPAATVSVVDAVGAGDAFASVWLLGLSLGWPLAQTLERAQAFASAMVGVRGATVQDAAFYRPYTDTWGLATS